MPNDNPQVKAFANEIVRVMADQLQSFVDASDEMIAKFNNEGIVNLIPVDDEIIIDGSPADSRTPITNRQVRIFIDICTVLRNDIHANNNQKYNQVDAISVNSREIF